MIKVAILGFGKVGQTVLNTIQQNALFKERFEVVALWNRSPQVFESFDISNNIGVYSNIPELMQHPAGVDLVVECSHPNVVKEYALDILDKASLFVSSPTAFADRNFRKQYLQKMEQNEHQCYMPLGASVGVWDVIRLDKDGQLKSLSVSMKKDPDAFKIKDAEVVDKMDVARGADEPVILAKATVAEINSIAPQNTNTMSVYALAAASLGFDACEGQIVADRKLDAHLVELKLETKGGLKLTLLRDNPANRGQVTGSATFGSFLNSLYHFQSGIRHNNFNFC